MKNDKDAYILGTDAEELYRLGLQHRVWSSEANKSFDLAGLSQGMNILDLGSGPGFVTQELAYLAGTSGRVTAVDRSANYIEHLSKLSDLNNLDLDIIHSDFKDLRLPEYKYDAAYCRWALAWVEDVEGILDKVFRSLKIGGKFIIQEYYEWSIHQVVPALPHLSNAIKASYKSFDDMPSDINIGRKIPDMLEGTGMIINNLRLVSKIARPVDLSWHWPKSFYHSYFPRIKEMGYLTEEEVSRSLKEVGLLERMKEAHICCPILIEIILEKSR